MDENTQAGPVNELGPPNPVGIIDPDTVQMALLECNHEAGKHVSALSLARKKLTAAKRKLEEHEAKLYSTFRWNTQRKWTKDEIERYCFPTDTEWRRLKSEVEKQQAMAEYAENSIKVIKDSGYNVRAWIDYQYFLEGQGRRTPGMR